MSQKVLPSELHLWQCATCERVMNLGDTVAPQPRHLKPVEDHAPRSPWCFGVLRRFTYRLVTQSDYVLRA